VELRGPAGSWPRQQCEQLVSTGYIVRNCRATVSDPRLCVGYVRVSTTLTSQDTSVEGQTFVLTERMKCDRVITERISASGSRRRPGWEELRALVASGQVRQVVVSDLSRLSRDGSDQQFLEECHLVGTSVVDVNGVEYENHTVAGLLTSGVLSLVNRAQSRIIGVKVAEGIRRRREAGFYGRPQAPFGYAYKGGRFVEHPQNWVHARWLIEELLRRDLNIYGTLRNLPPDFPRSFSRLGLRKWLNNPILRGGVGLGWDHNAMTYDEVVWGHAPILVPPAEWDTINRALQVRQRTRGTKTGFKAHLFTGLIRCDECGKFLWWAASRSRPTPRYQCCNLACSFHGRSIREVVLTTAVQEALSTQAAMLAREASRHDSEGRKPTQRELELRDRLDRLERLQREGTQGLTKAIASLQAELLGLDPHGPAVAQSMYQHLFENPAIFNLATPDELRALMVALVDRVDFHGRPNGFTIQLRDLG